MTQASKKAVPTAKPIRRFTVQNKRKADQWTGLSAEGMGKQASATTEVLSEILEHGARTHQIRHWGINE